MSIDTCKFIIIILFISVKAYVSISNGILQHKMYDYKPFIDLCGASNS